MPKITVIIPAYNVEDYIHKSLDSIVNQTFDDYEVLVVNDGSADRTAEIIDEYAAKYPFIQAIHQTNAGQSAARNKAIRLSKADYIALLDSDDWVEPNFLEALYAKAIETNADLTFCGYNMIEANTGNVIPCTFPLKGYPESFLFKDYPNALIDNVSIAWNKLYKKEMFFKHDIFFAEGKKYEDLLSGTLMVLNANIIAQVSLPLYNYLIHREGATTRLYDFNKFSNIVEHLDFLEKYVQKNNASLTAIFNTFKKQYIYFFLPEYCIRTEDTSERKKQIDLYSKTYGAVQKFNEIANFETIHFRFSKYTKKIQFLLKIFYKNKKLFNRILSIINKTKSIFIGKDGKWKI